MSLVFWNIAVIIRSLATNYWTLFAFHTLMVISQAGLETLAPTWIADLFRKPEKNNPKTVSIWLCIYYAGVPFSGGLAHVLVKWISTGWRWAMRKSQFAS